MTKAGLATCLLLLICFIASPQTVAGQSAAANQNPSDAAHTLSESQKRAIKQIQLDAERKAGPAALRLASVVHQIYENMLSDKPNERLRSALSARMKAAAWELLSIKGQAIRETVNVLTPEQKQLLKIEMKKPGAPADLAEVIAHTFKLADK